MICPSCKNRKHDKCLNGPNKAGTWCDCQHKKKKPQ